MRAVAESTASLGEELVGTNNVLLLASAHGDEDAAACGNLLTVARPDRSDVLCLTYNQTPDARLEHWRTHDGPTSPDKLGFIVAGDSVRSAAAVDPSFEYPIEDDLGPTVTSVSNPADLTGLGIKFGDFFTDWDGDGNRLLLCFHTLSTFLQYADHRTAYRFLHVLTGRIREIGGIAHYHLDPAAHDEQTINSLMALFDAVVEPDADGAWEITRRR